MNIMFMGGMDDYWAKVLAKLEAAHIHVIYAVGHEKLGSIFPRSRILNLSDLQDPEFYVKENRNSRYVLSEEFILSLQKCENIFLAMSDRLSFFNVSVRRRRIIYYDMILYWYTLLKDNRIDCLIFNCSPQMAPDITLYFVAKALKVRTLSMERTCIADTSLFLEDYEKIEKVPEDYLEGRTRDELVDMLGREYYENIRKENYWVKLVKEKIKLLQGSSKFSKKCINALRLLFKLLKIHRYGRKVDESAFYFNSPVRNGVLMLINILKGRQAKKLNRYYKKLTKPVNFKDKYVYFPLQFQPERTSIPLGSVFENQILALQVLDKTVPPDWKILVKEHPRQLKAPRFSCRHYRTKEYYDRIQSIPKVQLVDLEANNKELIQDAEFVSTLSGTNGWEAMINGKACMVFGFPWYLGCRSCFRVSSVEEAQKAIEAISHKSASEIELDLLKYLAYYKNKFYETVHSHSFAIRSTKDYDLLTANLVKALVSALSKTVPEGAPASSGI